MAINLVKKDDKGRVYDAGDFRIYYRSENTITGDNSENQSELIYLIAGSAEVTIGDSMHTAVAPAQIDIPATTYHKIKAITEIIFVLFLK